MREIDGLSYSDLAGALDVTVPAVKSLLVRARVGLVEAQESRDADCQEIRRDLMASYDRGVKASGRARRHMRECAGCREYRLALRGVRRSFAALTPAGAGPAALLAKLIGIGGASGGAAAASGGGGAVVTGGAATATACKVAAVVCATAITAGGAVEVRKLANEPAPKRERAASASRTAAPERPKAQAAPVVASSQPQPVHATPAAAAPAAAPREHAGRGSELSDEAITAPPPAPVGAIDHEDAPVLVGGAPQVSSGGTAAPEDDAAETGTTTEPSAGALPEATATPAPGAEPAGTATPTAEPTPTAATPPTTPPPPER